MKKQTQNTLSWCQYLQLAHLICHLNQEKHLQPTLTDFEQLIYMGTIGQKGLISSLYNALLQPNLCHLPFYTVSWIKEDSSFTTYKQWGILWSSSINRSKFLNVHIQHFKFISHWYLTPHRLRLMNKTISPLYWRNCGQTATQLHIWWACPFINVFWKHALACIKCITGVTVPFQFDIMLLSFWPSTQDSVIHQELILLLLAATHLFIAQMWKRPLP